MNKKNIFTCLIGLLIISSFLSNFSNAQSVNEKNPDSDRALPFFGYVPSENINEISHESETIEVLSSLPSSWDWRDVEGYDFTTPVKSQGSCGSCWAFAAIGALESVIKLENQNACNTPDLSEQYLVSCCDGFCNGCRGGCAYYALRWLDREDKIPNEGNFSYTAIDANGCKGDDDCGYPPTNCKSGDWSDYSIGNPYATDDPSISSLKEDLIKKGPLVTTMVASDNLYDTYDGGVYHYFKDANDKLKKEGSNPNHQAVIVGYQDVERSILHPYDGYWICKNSWGTDWGENGWFRVAYGYCLIDASRIISPEYSNPDAPDPKLDVSKNSLYFQKGDTIQTFRIENIGDEDSLLIWYTTHWIDSGTIKSISPSSGILKKGEPVRVDVEKFRSVRLAGELDIHIYRSDKYSDHKIRISTQLQKDKKISIQPLQQMFFNHPNLFPLLQRLLNNLNLPAFQQ